MSGHDLVGGVCPDCGWSGTDAEYLAAYRANQAEARGKYERALARYRQFREAGQITPKPEGGWVCQGPTASQVLGDLLRWRSDLDHWSERVAEYARKAAGHDRDQGDGDAADFDTDGAA